MIFFVKRNGPNAKRNGLFAKGNGPNTKRNGPFTKKYPQQQLFLSPKNLLPQFYHQCQDIYK